MGLINRVYHSSGRLHNKSRDICTPVRRNYLQGPIHWEISFIEYVSEQAIMPGRKSPLGVTGSDRIKALLLTLNFEKNIIRPPPQVFVRLARAHLSYLLGGQEKWTPLVLVLV